MPLISKSGNAPINEIIFYIFRLGQGRQGIPMEGKGPATLLEERRVDPDEASAAASAISAGTETVLGLVERLGPLLTHSEVGWIVEKAFVNLSHHIAPGSNFECNIKYTTFSETTTK